MRPSYRQEAQFLRHLNFFLNAGGIYVSAAWRPEPEDRTSTEVFTEHQSRTKRPGDEHWKVSFVSEVKKTIAFLSVH